MTTPANCGCRWCDIGTVLVNWLVNLINRPYFDEWNKEDRTIMSARSAAGNNTILCLWHMKELDARTFVKTIEKRATTVEYQPVSNWNTTLYYNDTLMKSRFALMRTLLIDRWNLTSRTVPSWPAAQYNEWFSGGWSAMTVLFKMFLI